MRMTPTAPPGLARRAAAELVGTAALVTVIVGSGIQAERLSADVGVALLANSLASALGLGVLIVLLGPLSGGHLNPAVTLCEWWARRGDADAPAGREVVAYCAGQLLGAVLGALVAEAMFGRTPGTWSPSTQVRSDPHLLLGETVATAGLVLLVVGLRRIDRLALAPVAVAGYIAAAIWFTSSGSFANPAASAGRALSDSFTGIAPSSLPGFVGAQLLGTVLGIALATVLYGRGDRSEPNGPRTRRTG